MQHGIAAGGSGIKPKPALAWIWRKESYCNSRLFGMSHSLIDQFLKSRKMDLDARMMRVFVTAWSIKSDLIVISVRPRIVMIEVRDWTRTDALPRGIGLGRRGNI